MNSQIESWDAVVFEVPSVDADEWVGELSSLGRGALLENAKPGRTRIRFYLASDMPGSEALDWVSARLAERGVGDTTPRIETVEDGHWVERYQASLKPFDLGRAFRVFPNGILGDAGERRGMVLVPSRAFGTGEHPTTRMCVELLETHQGAGERWVDLGCGSAILSIVARHTGIESVLALDMDAEVVRVADEVLEANQAREGIDLQVGTLESIPDQAWDGIVANIHAPIFLGNAAALADKLRPGGVLIASGFPIDHAQEVVDALARAGMRETDRRETAPWAAVRFERGL